MSAHTGTNAPRALVLAALLAAPAAAHVRLIHPTNGNPLKWTNPADVSIVVNAAGSDDIPDGSHLPALQIAIRSWNGAEGTTAFLDEDTSSAAREDDDWESDGLHSILFDEDDSSGYFPSGTGIVALTPVWFVSSGTITDADVLFNGSDFEFTTSAVPGRFDVQDVATHELGHLLGLDHSGWGGATMYPYVDPAVILHRSISLDDEHGLRDLYPEGTWARIRGTVTRASNGNTVAGAHVVAVDADGRTAGGALADEDGDYALKGLAAGTYTVWANPLDQPVSAANLGDGYTVVTTFQATELATVAVAGGETLDGVDGAVNADAAIALGRNTDELPLRAEPGLTSLFSLHGTGLAASGTLTASDPDLTIEVLSALGTVITFSVEVPSDELPGHVDLLATDVSGNQSLLPAAIEIAAAEPTVSDVSPVEGTLSGGTEVTLTGTGFRAGARVVLANKIYTDGAANGCTVEDDTTITLTTRASAAGVWDVVVQDATGVEGRAAGAFEFAALPQIASVFPATGWSGGGTLVHVRGSDLVAGSTVRIDGATQSAIAVLDDQTLRFTTAASVPGGPYLLEIETPEGDIASSAFSFQVDPDPAITSIDPDAGTTAGGDVITIHGSGFTEDAEVVFGADPATGLGGTSAAVSFLDGGRLRVTTPSGSAGATDVLVRLLLSEQAVVATNAFTFESPLDDGGSSGGGGCSVAPQGGARGPFDGGSGLLPLLVAFAWVALRARQPRPVELRVRAR